MLPPPPPSDMFWPGFFAGALLVIIAIITWIAWDRADEKAAKEKELEDRLNLERTAEIIAQKIRLRNK